MPQNKHITFLEIHLFKFFYSFTYEKIGYNEIAIGVTLRK